MARPSALAGIGLIIGLSSAAPAVGANTAQNRAEDADYGAYLSGRVAQLERDWKNAGAYLRSASDLDRENPDLRHEAFLLSLAGGDLGAAVSMAHSVPKDSPDVALGHLVLAVDDLANGRFAPAKAELAALPAQGAERYLAPMLQAWCEVGLGHEAAAEMALAPLDSIPGTKPLHQLQEAIVADALGNSKLALERYDAIVAKTPKPQEALLAAGFYVRQGKPDRARALLDAIDPDGPESAVRREMLARLAAHHPPPPKPTARTGAAMALFQIAASLSVEEPRDAALIYTQLALRVDPTLVSAQFLLAQLNEQQARLDQAANTLLAVDPASEFRSTAERQAMLDLATDGQLDRAIALGQKGIDSHKDDTDLALAFADLLRRKNRYPDAIRVYGTVLAKLPQTSNRRGMALFGRGMAYERSHQWPSAEADLQAALLLRPNDPELLNYLAFAWTDQGQHLDRARTMLERAIELSPDNGAFIDSLGWVMFKQGDFEDAAKQLERAVELDGDDATINDHLGDAYWRLGRHVEAKSQWERAVRFTDDKVLSEQIRAKLRDGLDGTPPERASVN